MNIKSRNLFKLIIPGSIALLPLITVVSCSNSKSADNNLSQYYKQTKSIAEDKSFKNIEKIFTSADGSSFFNTTNEEKFEKDLKDMFKKEIVLDEESEIYKELESNGKIKEFKDMFVDKMYDSFIEEAKKENVSPDNLKHFGFVSIWHIIETVAMHLQALAVNMLVAADIMIPFAPAITQFVLTGNPLHLLKPLASYKGMSERSKQLVFSFVNDLKKWKERRGCKSVFFVWGAFV